MVTQIEDEEEEEGEEEEEEDNNGDDVTEREKNSSTVYVKGKILSNGRYLNGIGLLKTCTDRLGGDGEEGEEVALLLKGLGEEKEISLEEGERKQQEGMGRRRREEKAEN
ncbi:unnamed protein product [Enterobius vermicularis]|uniref:Uncharacterized protein n=1 Tax=Enterobius vermicularis TaxID=51028 RepID=A0A0N4V375_ENTVE|nr:unnamed protein product [Enterobius vermicularis]